MIKNYFVTAVRNIWRSKTSTIINVSGLAMGMGAGLILFLLVRYQHGFDTLHTKRDRIYRVVQSSDGNQGRNYNSGVAAVLPEAFRLDFPEAEEVLFTSYRAGELITIPQTQGEPKRYEEDKGIVYTQPNYFKIFDRKVLLGDAEKGLDDPNEAILSESLAVKYFGDKDAIGHVIKVEDVEYKVTAIIEDAPAQTDLPFNLLLSYSTIKKSKEEPGWGSIWSDDNCYFLLNDEHKISEIEARVPAFVKKHLGNENADNVLFEMQPLSEVHFDERFNNYNYNTVSRQMLLALTVIGIFLMITACINFINLVTAEAIKRSKEVGIRKTMGSSRAQLVFQFLGESSLVTLLSVILAVGLAQVALKFVNVFLRLNLALNFMSDSSLWLFVVLTGVAVAFLSGSYPSFVVSGFKPVFAIKNQMNAKNSSSYSLRRGLVVLQFFISQGLIIGTIVLISQMNYFRSKELGFRKDAIVNIPIPENSRSAGPEASSRMRTFRDEMAKLKGVELASLSNKPPSSGSVSSTDFQIEGKEDRFGTQVKLIDGNYVDLYELKLVAGKNVNDLDTAQGFIVNEKLSSMVGFQNPQDIIGKVIKMWGKNLPVVGVVKDFHTMSLREPIEATIMFNRIRDYSTLSLKVNPADMQEVIATVKQKWEATYPAFIFSHEFLDEEIREFYEGEQRMSTMLGIFTSLAIFIGCLGLFGLATFMANQKTKEVGIRKVLGASVESIILMFTKEYVKLILIGFFFAVPVAWYVMNQWLSDFAYKIELGPSEFLVGLAVTVIIALVTVGYRSFSAAMANPAHSLKSE